VQPRLKGARLPKPASALQREHKQPEPPQATPASVTPQQPSRPLYGSLFRFHVASRRVLGTCLGFMILGLALFTM
jgi:hypothetical protein